MYNIRLLAVAVFSSAILFVSCKKENSSPVTPVNPVNPVDTTKPTPTPNSGDNDHMFLGNPSNAAAITDSFNNYLMRKTYYALSYSKDRGISNWVSWHLFFDDIGSTQRQDDFREDYTLPLGWYLVGAGSYSGSGFDRGHNCPSADRTKSVEANSSTFLMTNMIPQAPNHNQQVWASFEDYVRSLINAGNEAYIIMGSYGKGGTGSKGYFETINNGNVTVPANIWKVALIIPNGNNDSARIDATTRVITINIPNNNSVGSNWRNYRTTVDAIESATGYNLFTRLPVALQDALEGKIDTQ